MRATKSLQTSHLLQQFLQQQSGDAVRLNDLLHYLGDRAFGPLLLLCALPEALPLPVAGVSAIVALPLLLVSAQLVLGLRRPWLPKWLGNRSLQRSLLERMIHQLLKYLHRFERFIQPRWRWLTRPLAVRIVGLLVFGLGIIIMLPIPFGNILPAIVIVIISIGLIERDGITIFIGCVMAGVTLILMSSAILALLSLFTQSSV